MDTSRKNPVVFVSSTCYDLKQVRADMKDFFEQNYGFDVMLSEFDSFPIDPCVGTFENCLSNVDQCADIFILIVGNRYGYVLDSGKSITNLEYLHAKAKGIPIYVFVSKQLNNTLPIWKANKSGDYSSVVDNPKIFEFVAEIKADGKQWIYTYETVQDMKITLKNQLRLIFADGLKFKAITSDPCNKVLNYDLPAGAVRMVVEKPEFWEYKFLAYVMRDEFDKLQKRKWDLKYGVFDGSAHNRTPQELISDISERFNEISKLVSVFDVLINTAMQEAIGEPGVPSDLEMMIYTAKRIAALYERFVRWSLYFKTLHADDLFTPLLNLLYDFPKQALNELDRFVDEMYAQFTGLPDVDDGIARKIKLNVTFDSSNLDEVNAEIARIQGMVNRLSA